MDFKRETYSVQVSQFIKKLIQTGELKPGDPVKEADLASKLGISRAPIREALQILVQDGLISAEPQKGKSVRVLTSKEIIDGYAITAILESAGVANSLDKWTEEDDAKLIQLMQVIKDKSENGFTIEEMVEFNDRLHRMFLSRCDNKQLLENARLYSSVISKYLCYNYWLKSCDIMYFYVRHKELAEAVLARDKAGVEKLIRAHYEEIGEEVSKLQEAEMRGNAYL